ncbi:P-loop containing nucleoside triphosphate hydrolases superfamily protein [Artemisia annua]|uniref:P-loop containing nucleoside triphosphate hydrolases superfamily protein n=1 Tax=Artemisia annua TaxID=35608 RepID=A0A2U1PV42_ARTAN|nr:P-loop containing nucleoside triphosphate hydrolases superfamily protein [Artemisia annua]
MASIRRLSRTIHTFRTIQTFPRTKTLTPSTSIHLPRHLTCKHSNSYKNSSRDVSRLNYVPAMLAGLLGLGLVDVAYADAPEAKDEAKVPLPPSTHVDMEAIAKKERARLEELLKSKRMTYGSYPRFTVAVKGQKVTIKFQIPPTCEIALLISNIVANLGVKVEERATGSDMALRAWDSGVAWQLTLSPPVVKKEAVQDKGSSDANSNDGDFCVLLFRSLISSDKPEMEFIKQGSFTAEELDALVSVLKLAGSGQSRIADRRGETAPTPSMDKSITSLEGMGVKIYGLKEPKIEDSKSEISWENIAGYTQQKRDIEDTILLALQSPEVYDEIARGTRCKFETNRPRAVLFEGPPGTGKTSCARVIANQAGAPLLYVPLEVIMSKYFGESERLLGKVFTLANEIPNGAIIFLDEVDSFATSRDSETHEATRRILSVILRQIDGFEQDKKVVVIAATNRKQDLDPALLSRFDSMITFGLPDQQTRQEIVAQYAKHLSKTELAELAVATEEMSGRDIRDVCQQAERRWASKIIRGQAHKDVEGSSLPPLQEYIDSAVERHRVLLASATQKPDNNSSPKKPQYDFL